MSNDTDSPSVATTLDEESTKRTTTIITGEMFILESLETLTRELDEIDRRRAALIVERNATIRSLRPYVSASRIGRITGLSSSGIYRIEKETHE